MMVYLLITNLHQSKYASFSNGLKSQYSTKNNQYPKDLILSADIIKNHRQNNYGIINTENNTSKKKISRNQTIVEIRNRKQQNNNIKQVFLRKVN